MIGLGATYTVDANHHAYISFFVGLQTPSAKWGEVKYGKLNNDGLPIGANDVQNLLTGFSDTFSAVGPGVGTDQVWSTNGLTATQVSFGTITPGAGAYAGYGWKLW